MNKQEFLNRLQTALSFLPQEELNERLSFYEEMIEDRIEDGCSEEEAVSEIGSVEEITSRILAETSLGTIAKERLKTRKRLTTWEWVLLILGSPIWLSLLITAAAVVFSLYVSLWSVVVSLWAADLSVAVSAVGALVCAPIYGAKGFLLSAIVMLAAALVCAGLGILLFFGCKALTKGMLWLTKNMMLVTKNCFLRKEKAL